MKLHRRILQFFIFVLAFSTFPTLFAQAAPHLETVRVTSGTAPIAENLSLETYTGISVTGNLTAADPDDTAFLFSVVTGPKKGTLTLQEDGAFVYTPREKCRGRDTFSYTATDPMGNISNVAQVTVRIRRAKSAVAYADTAGTAAAYGAQYLAEQGLCIGEQVDGTWLFHPDEIMTQGEFLALSMALSDLEPEENIAVTGYANDGEIPVWLKPYLSAAAASAVPAGTFADAPVFQWNEPVTDRNAALLLDELLQLTDVVCEDAADQSAANVEACRIMTCGETETALTRGDAARILAAAGTFLENRN